MVEETKIDNKQAIEALAAHGITVDVDYFNANGVGIVRNFATPEEVKGMIDRMGELVEEWDPKSSVEFRTDNGQI